MAIVNNTSTSPAEQASEIGVEIWREIVGYEGLYSVSNLGRVRSLVDRRGAIREKLLKPVANRKGYFFIILYKARTLKRHSVHRLVLRAFKRARYIGQDQCRHLNGDPTDNRLFTLAFGTAKENEADKITHGTSNRGERHGLAKLTEEQVREIRRLCDSKEHYQYEVGKMFNVSRQLIGYIVSGKLWAHIS